MIKEKRGWIRVVEAIIAILIIISVVLVFISRNTEKPDISKTMQDLEKSLLETVARNDTMRHIIVNYKECTLPGETDCGPGKLNPLNDFIKDRIPIGLRNNSATCVSEPGQTCKPSGYDVFTLGSEVFVDDRVIFENGKTKKLSLFIWLK